MKRKIIMSIKYKEPGYFIKILVAGFLFWIMENVYFGWNETAQSGAERIADVISLSLVWYGLIGMIAVQATREIFKSINLEADFVDVCENYHCHCGNVHEHK